MNKWLGISIEGTYGSIGNPASNFSVWYKTRKVAGQHSIILVPNPVPARRWFFFLLPERPNAGRSSILA
jgi:hypothetical protein